MPSKKFYSAVACGLLVVSSAGVGDPKPSAKSVGDGLMCQCGCPETVTLCNHPVCSSRTEMQAQIQREIDAGKSETSIVQDFILRYGVKVLATPPATGFNRMVWILPAAVLMGGLALVLVFTRRWRRPATEAVAAVPAAIEPKLLAAVEEEMKRSGIRD